MIKKVLFILVVLVFVLVGIKLKHSPNKPLFVGFGITFKADEPSTEQILSIPNNIAIPINYDITLLQKAKQHKLTNITITSYNNTEKQTDNTPNIMASNRIVYEGAVAVSRDIKHKYKIHYGDLIYVPVLDKYFVIEDLMNRKFNNRIDIFSFDEQASRGIFFTEQDIIVFRFDRD